MVGEGTRGGRERRREGERKGRERGSKGATQARRATQERGEAWAAGGRKRAGEGLREERMEQGSNDIKRQGRYPEYTVRQGRYPEYTVYSHPIPQRALAIATLLLQMKYSEHV